MASKTIDFNELVSNYSNRLYKTAICIVRDPYIAEDIVQETFIKAFKKIDTIEDEGKIGGWLSCIATRTAIDFLRSDKRKNCILVDQVIIEQVQMGTDYGVGLEQEAAATFLKDDIQELLTQLSSEYQEVLLLKAKFGLKEDEIANALQIKSSTVKTRLYRARKQLKSIYLQKCTA
ncbi:RNA polymerase sigma factor [Mesobacillus harenae]|uniref:RNA polymerase sigma factor n=1 Tax=Mesobacillus harenae TaxID=2213203 RepID=UPI0030D2F55A